MQETLYTFTIGIWEAIAVVVVAGLYSLIVFAAGRFSKGS